MFLGHITSENYSQVSIFYEKTASLAMECLFYSAKEAQEPQLIIEPAH